MGDKQPIWTKEVKDFLYQLLFDEHWSMDEKTKLLGQQFVENGWVFTQANIEKEISENQDRYKDVVYMRRSRTQWSWEMVSAFWYIIRSNAAEPAGSPKMLEELEKLFSYRRRFFRDMVRAEYYGANRAIYASPTRPTDLIPLEAIREKYREAQQIAEQMKAVEASVLRNLLIQYHQQSQVPASFNPQPLHPLQHPISLPQQGLHPGSQLLHAPTFPIPPAQQGLHPGSQLLQGFHPSPELLHAPKLPNPPAHQDSHPSSKKPSSSMLSKPPSWYDDEAELGWMLHMSGQYVEIGMDGKEFVNCSAIGEVLKSHFGDRRVYDFDTVLTELSKSAYQNHDHAPPGIGPYPHPASGQAQPVHSSSSHGQGQSQHQEAAAGHDGHKAPGTSHTVASSSSSSARPGKMESSASKSVRENRVEPYRKDSREKDKGRRPRQ